MASSSILFQNASKTVVLLDLPRSLEEAQVPSHRLSDADPPKLPRLVSAPPPTTPFTTPEPKSANAIPSTSSPASQVAELMAFAATEAALAEIQASHNGPWCLPRICCSRGPSPHPADDDVKSNPP